MSGTARDALGCIFENIYCFIFGVIFTRFAFDHDAIPYFNLEPQLEIRFLYSVPYFSLKLLIGIVKFDQFISTIVIFKKDRLILFLELYLSLRSLILVPMKELLMLILAC